MRFGKSCFNAALYKKNLARFWPVWGLYLVIWMFILPIDLVLSEYTNPALRFSQRDVLRSIGEAGLVLSVAFALLTAVAVWSYLFNNRSTSLMHSMPIRREGLFLTNFLSGMSFFVGPNLVIFLLTLLAEALVGCVALGPLVTWLAAVTLMELYFFCFATFCGMFTGHILGLPAYYGILSVLPMALVALLDSAFSRFVFGYAGIDGLYVVAQLLSPIWALSSSLAVNRVEEVAVGTADAAVHYEFTGWTGILIYAAVGLILAGLALVVYRRRHMERAGDAVTVAWVRPVFQYGVAFCCALAFGVLFFEIFSGILPETAWTLLVLMLISGAVGYFLAKMILEKSFRVFGCWKGCLPFLAALVVLVCGMEFDVTGYERRVPDQNQLASVSVTDLYSAPYDEGTHAFVLDNSDPEFIRTVLDLHQAVVDNKDAMVTEYSREQVSGGYYVELETTRGFHVSYTLKSGKVITRDYNSIPVRVKEQDDPQTVSGKLNALINLPRVVESTYGLTDRKADELIGVTLISQYGTHIELGIDKAAFAQVYEAVLADFAEGNLGRRYLMNDREQMNTCFVNDLEFIFYHEKSGEEIGVDIPAATVEAVPVDSVEWAEKYRTTRITVTLQTTARHTLAALDRAGVLPEPVYLLTQAQMDAAGAAADKAGISWDAIDLARYAEEIIGG